MNTQKVATLQPKDLHEIRLTVTSDGTTGEQWIERLKGKNICVDTCAEQLLLSPDFKPTNGVIYKVVIINGSFWGTLNERVARNIRAEANKRDLVVPNAEVACLLREAFTTAELQAMGLLVIVIMHEPIQTNDLCPRLLDLEYQGGRWGLRTFFGDSEIRWNNGSGFVFVVS